MEEYLLESLDVEDGCGYIVWSPPVAINFPSDAPSFTTHFAHVDSRGHRTGVVTKIRCPPGGFSEFVRHYCSVNFPMSHDEDAHFDEIPTLAEVTGPVELAARVRRRCMPFPMPPPPPPLTSPPLTTILNARS